MKTFLAVDFGTTQTSVARLMEGSEREPEVIEVNDGQRAVKAIATAMQLDGQGNILYFGAKALAKAEEAPEMTFQNFKVFMGRDEAYQIQTEQSIYTPGKLTRLFLVRLRKQIESSYFNGVLLTAIPEMYCIIGCPSDWDEVQKENLKRTAGEAGFPNIRLCDEPIGVIYYNHFYGGLDLKKSQNILVYDFGGGTTDVAIAQVKLSAGGKIEPSILSVSGIPNLGGRNFDDAVAAYYMMDNGFDLGSLSLRDRLHDKWVINLAARSAKEELSSKESVEKTINRLKTTGGLKPPKLQLTRKKFVEVCSNMIEVLDEPVHTALTDADLSVDDIDVVILAGGSSAMPFVRERMSRVFPSEKIRMSPSIDIIAQGLAVFGKVETLGMKAKTPEVKTASDRNSSDRASGGRTSRETDTQKVHEEYWEGRRKQQEENKAKKHRTWLLAAVIGAALVLGGLIYQISQMQHAQSVMQRQLDSERQARQRAELQIAGQQTAGQQTQSSSEGHPILGAIVGGTIGFFLGGPAGLIVGAGLGAAAGD